MVDRTGLRPGGLQPPAAAVAPPQAGRPQRALRGARPSARQLSWGAGLPGGERRALRPDQLQEPRPMGLLPLGRVGGVADHVAASPRALAAPHGLPPPRGRAVAVAAGAGAASRYLGALAPRHRQDGPAQGPAQPLPRRRGAHPASPPQTQRCPRQPRNSSVRWSIVVTSAVWPGPPHERTGRPARVRASPTTPGRVAGAALLGRPTRAPRRDRGGLARLRRRPPRRRSHRTAWWSPRRPRPPRR